MSRSVYRYGFDLVPGELQEISMLPGPILHVDNHLDPAFVNLWVEVETSDRAEKRVFTAYATGEFLDPGFSYVGTIKTNVGGHFSGLADVLMFVWHVYEKKEQG